MFLLINPDSLKEENSLFNLEILNYPLWGSLFKKEYLTLPDLSFKKKVLIMLSGAQDSSFSTFLERFLRSIQQKKRSREGRKRKNDECWCPPWRLQSVPLFFHTGKLHSEENYVYLFVCVPPSRFINATCWSKPKRRLLFFKRQIRPLNTWIDRNDVTLFEWLIKRRNLFSHSQDLPKKTSLSLVIPSCFLLS